MAEVNIKSVKDYLLAALAAEQQKPHNPLKGDLSKRDKALLLVAGEALKAQEADYINALQVVLDKAQKQEAELGQVRQLLERFTSN